MTFDVTKGTTILVPDEVNNPNTNYHLHVILTDPSPSRVLTVPVYTVRKFQDPACLLHEGDHSFIKWDSYVVYQKIDERPAHGIAAAVNREVFIPKEPVAEPVYRRIVEGFHRSRFTPRKFLGSLPNSY